MLIVCVVCGVGALLCVDSHGFMFGWIDIYFLNCLMLVSWLCFGFADLFYRFPCCALEFVTG